MQQGFRGAVRRSTWLIGAACGAWLAPACHGGTSDARPQATAGGIFGGTGGVIDAVPLAGTSGSVAAGGTGGSGDAALDPCRDTPPGTVALIDDFDDGDSVAAFEADREAYWFTVHDESAGQLEPADEFLPVAGGYHNTNAAHVSASGFSTWGAELGANISHKTAIRCPYNASAFAGLRFVARGHGRMRLQVAMPEVIDKEYGGKCDPQLGQTCYDLHGIFITLTDDYRLYEVPWSQLVQRGFGAPVTFNPKTLMTLYFLMETPDLPVDLWVDDFSFWDGVPSELGAGGGAGTGDAGAASEAGGAGETNSAPAGAGGAG